MDIAEARDALIRLKDALARKDRAASNAIALACIAGDAPLGQQWKAIAALLKQNGEASAARQAITRFAEWSGNSPQAQYEQAAIFAQTGQVAEAYDLLLSLPADMPTPHANAYSRGTMATNLGRFDEARVALRQSLAAMPASGQARLALAMAGPIGAEDAALIEGRQDLRDSQVPLEQAAWLYAIGRLFEQRRDVARAFAAYAGGAAIMARLRPADLQQDRDEAKQSSEGWEPGVVARLAAEVKAAGPSRPIFVTGLPRSGTTLVEQILVSHSAVDAGEELGFMRLLHQDIGGHGLPDLQRHLAAGGTMAGLRALYDHLIDERYPGARRVVDKTLNSSRSIGLIRALFADAPIVWVRRDPIDCAWSAFRNWFNQGLDWSWSQPAMAWHFRLEDALFFHWRKLFPANIHVVPYEKLVTDPETTISAMLAFCGLAPEAAVFAPEKTVRAVTTASVAQVRQGINTRAVGSAQEYSAHLKPFADAYLAIS